MLTPRMNWDEAKAVVDAKPHPKVTKASIEAKIADIRYLLDGVMTICVIELKNGFKVVGKAAPADERNFDLEVGQTYSYDDAFKQLWPLEGYLLRERLHNEDSG